MATKDEKTRVLRIIEEAFNKGNMNALDEIVSPDIVYHVPPRPDVKGLQAYKEYLADLRKAFTGFRFTIHELITEGNTDAGRWTIQGTHTGQLPGSPVPPTGKQVTMTGLYMTHVVTRPAPTR
ncbi:MAG: ester cyclase [Syntrophorhabdales bacterium]|jgi:predicted ester cyclase